jgi:hypothetical protein
VRPEGTSFTSSGLNLESFRLVAQCLHRYATSCGLCRIKRKQAAGSSQNNIFPPPPNRKSTLKACSHCCSDLGFGQKHSAEFLSSSEQILAIQTCRTQKANGDRILRITQKNVRITEKEPGECVYRRCG